MKSYTEYIWFNTEKIREDINITKQIKEVLNKSKIGEGILVISTMHVSAGLYIDDYEPEISDEAKKIDLKKGSKGSDASEACDSYEKGTKNISINQQVTIPVTFEKLDMGLWQQIFYAEFDGKRKKKIVVKVIGE